MMKKIVITAALIMLVSGKVYASGGIECDLRRDADTGAVDVIIRLDEVKKGTAAAVRVENGNGELVYAKQGYFDGEGKYEISYINKDQTGEYTLYYAAPRLGYNDSTEFCIMTESLKEAILRRYRECVENKDAEGIRTIIETYGEHLLIDMTDFNALRDGTAVYDFMAHDTGITIETAKSIKDAFYGAVIVNAIKEDRRADVYKRFLYNAEYSVLNTDSIPMGNKKNMFEEAESDLQGYVLGAAVEKQYNSAAELTPTLTFLMLSESIKNAVQWSDIYPALKKYADAGLLHITFDGYNKLKDSSKVDMELKGREFLSYEQIEQAFNSAVNKYNVTPPTPSSGSGGGGSGKVIQSVAKPEPAEKTDETPHETMFTDLQGEYIWAAEAVDYLVSKGIISGMGDNTFAPSDSLTREQVSSIIARTRKLDIEGKSSSFADVPNDRWSYPYVSAVYEEGLMVGFSEDNFGAVNSITRAEYAVIMKRLIDLYEVTLTEATKIDLYDDQAEIPSWAADSAEYLKKTGLMLAAAGNEFRPNEAVTRAEACDVLYNVLSAIMYE